MRPINWSSPADILEKIIAYEAVHAIDSWDDLRRRLKPEDRRCFGFFHPSMPNEPLIFVEVALTKGIPNSSQDLLTDEREAISASDADTAVFYSISNCQAGLAGISFGNSLIKQVAADLAQDLPGLASFVTLSPIPSLNRWMKQADLPKGVENQSASLAAYYLLEAKTADGIWAMARAFMRCIRVPTPRPMAWHSPMEPWSIIFTICQKFPTITNNLLMIKLWWPLQPCALFAPR